MTDFASNVELARSRDIASAEELSQFSTREERRMAIVSEILAADPSIGYISALIIAGDRLSAERAASFVNYGEMKAMEAVEHVGSYARLDFALRMHEAGKITRATLLKNLPSLWRDSDPDDTDPRFLKLWKDARKRHGKIISDSARDLRRVLTIVIYRGQDRGARLGIAWTTDRKIAEKYARGMALRQHDRDGEVLRGEVAPRHVLAFLTKRNESEVIVDPTNVTIRNEAAS